MNYLFAMSFLFVLFIYELFIQLHYTFQRFSKDKGLEDLSYLQHLEKNRFSSEKDQIKDLDPNTVQIVTRPMFSLVSLFTIKRFFLYYPPKQKYIYHVENPFCLL